MRRLGLKPTSMWRLRCTKGLGAYDTLLTGCWAWRGGSSMRQRGSVQALSLACLLSLNPLPSPQSSKYAVALLAAYSAESRRAKSHLVRPYSAREE